jgi:chromosome segregation ATPase
MEHLYPLLTIFSGATIVLLGSFLFAAERELKRKRREIDRFKRTQTAQATEQHSESSPSPESIPTNDPIRQGMEVLSGGPEQSQKTADERQNDPSLLLSAQSENQQLQEKINNLKGRLITSQTELAESNKRIHEACDLNTKLQIETAGWKQQLAEKDEAIIALQSRALEGAKMKSENQKSQIEKQHLLEQVSNLQDQLRTAEERLSAIDAQHDAIAERNAQLQLSHTESKQHTEELIAKNTELQAEVDALSSQLAAAENSLEDLRSAQREEDPEKQQLLESHRQFTREIGVLHQQLETMQLQLGESVQRNQEAAVYNEKLQAELEQSQTTIAELQNSERHYVELARQYQEASDRCARLEMEVSDYREQLEHSQSKAREMESAQLQLANVESRELVYQEQQQKLEALIADLEHELSEGKYQVEALEDTHERLRETERVCQELGDENRRLGEEISRWQKRLAAGEENQRQVSMLRQQLDELQTEHARLIDTNRQAEKERAANRPNIGLAQWSSDSEGAKMLQSKLNMSVESSDLAASDEARGSPFAASSSAPVTAVANELNASQIAWRAIARHWHIGAVFAGVILLLVAGTVAMKILTAEAPNSGDPVVLAPEATSFEPVAAPASKPPVLKAAPRLRGSFQTVRPAQVFSGPSENSALIANIGQGTRLNVVDSVDGWLEIRSKHGRPPGFIRQEAAVRLSSN